jgi:predicted ester cyclase
MKIVVVAGRDGMKHLLVQLTTTFPDLKVTNEEILQEGNKVIVRSQLTGTQRGDGRTGEPHGCTTAARP